MRISIKFFVLATITLFSFNANAQFLIDQRLTNYTPIRTPKIEFKDVKNIQIGNNSFTGRIIYQDGVINKYQGSLTYQDGSVVHCNNFTPNFLCPNNYSYLQVNSNKTKAVKYTNRNGQAVKTMEWDLEGRSWLINVGELKVYYAEDSAPAYNYGGTYNNSYNSGGSGSSSYNSSASTCRGCNGSGRCQQCGGTGRKTNNHIGGGTYSCSLCHGTGRCQSCAGTGKIH